MLNEATIGDLKPPPGKAQIRVQDHKQRALYLIVGATKKTWMLRRGNTWTRVGGWPALNANAARRRALELLAAADTGRPMGLTVEAAYELWKKQKPRAASTLRNHREYLNLHFGDWQDIDLAKITRQDMQRRHEKVTRERGPKAANNGAKGFRAWWSAAQKIDEHLPACPTVAVNWHEQAPVDESALLARLPEWSALLETAVVNPLRRTMLRFMLLTGLRSGDVKAMKWDQVRGDMLHIPTPKGGRSFDLPLLTCHLDLLEAARPHSRRGRVFPLFNARLSPGEQRRFGDLQWSPHSLRRVFISAAVEAGRSPYEIALLVNHKVPGVTFGYVAKGTDVRPAMQRVTERLLRVTGSLG